MRRMYALIEQMDMAQENLRVQTPVAARVALILVDNTVELVLHTTCEHEVRLDRARGPMLPNNYDEQTRREVMGQRFDRKLSLCRSLGMMSSDTARTVAITHGYRNELYHSGVRYDPIILPMAWEYFAVACELLPKMRTGWWLVEDPDSDRVNKYLDEDERGMVDPHTFDELGERLLSQRPPLPKPSKELLSEFALDLVNQVAHNLEFLVADNFGDWNEEETLEQVQFHHCTWRDEGGPRVDTSNTVSVAELDAQLKKLRQDWTPRHRISPVRRWMERAEGIATSRHWHHALQRFQRLREEMAYLGGILAEAAAELDHVIQMEIDRAREN